MTSMLAVRRTRESFNAFSLGREGFSNVSRGSQKGHCSRDRHGVVVGVFSYSISSRCQITAFSSHLLRGDFFAVRDLGAIRIRSKRITLVA